MTDIHKDIQDEFTSQRERVDNSYIEKGRKLPIGTIRTYGDKQYKKISDTGDSNNDWQVIKEDKPKVEEKKEYPKAELKINTVEFVPSGNMIKAEDFILNNSISKSVNADGFTLHDINTINKELIVLKKETGITLKKFEYLNKTWTEGGVLAIRDDAELSINTKEIKNGFDKNTSNYVRINRNISDIEKEIKEYKDLGWDSDIPKLKNRLHEYQKALRESPEYFSSSQYAETYEERIKYVIEHEWTHAVQADSRIIKSKINKEIAKRYSEVMVDVSLKKLYTDYAMTEYNEFWAESNALYRNKKLKDAVMIRLIEKQNKILA